MLARRSQYEMTAETLQAAVKELESRFLNSPGPPDWVIQHPRSGEECHDKKRPRPLTEASFLWEHLFHGVIP